MLRAVLVRMLRESLTAEDMSLTGTKYVMCRVTSSFHSPVVSCTTSRTDGRSHARKIILATLAVALMVFAPAAECIRQVKPGNGCGPGFDLRCNHR